MRQFKCDPNTEDRTDPAEKNRRHVEHASTPQHGYQSTNGGEYSYRDPHDGFIHAYSITRSGVRRAILLTCQRVSG